MQRWCGACLALVHQENTSRASVFTFQIARKATTITNVFVLHQVHWEVGCNTPRVVDVFDCLCGAIALQICKTQAVACIRWPCLNTG